MGDAFKFLSDPDFWKALIGTLTTIGGVGGAGVAAWKSTQAERAKKRAEGSAKKLEGANDTLETLKSRTIAQEEQIAFLKDRLVEQRENYVELKGSHDELQQDCDRIATELGKSRVREEALNRKVEDLTALVRSLQESAIEARKANDDLGAKLFKAYKAMQKAGLSTPNIGLDDEIGGAIAKPVT